MEIVEFSLRQHSRTYSFDVCAVKVPYSPDTSSTRMETSLSATVGKYEEVYRSSDINHFTLQDAEWLLNGGMSMEALLVLLGIDRG